MPDIPEIPLHEMTPDEIRKAIRARADALGAILTRFPTMDVLAHFAFHEEYANPAEYVEETHQGQQAFVEYLTLMALKAPCSEGVPPFAELDLAEIHEAVSDIFRLSMHLAPPRFSRENPTREQVGWLACMIHRHTLMVRNPGFKVHRDGVLDALCGAPLVDSWLRTNLGFDYAQARSLNRGVESLINGRFVARQKSVKSLRESYLRAIRQYQKGGGIQAGLSPELIRSLALLKPGQLKVQIRDLTRRAVFGGYAEMVRFTVPELAKEAGVPVATATAYVAARQSDFSSVPAEFAVPELRDELMHRPFLHHKGCYLVPVLAALDWGLRPFIEHRLNPESSPDAGGDPQAWQAYKDARARYLEGAALDALASVLPGCRAESNLTYRVRLDGKSIEGEADGVLVWGPVAFLLEAKSGALSAKARSGSLPHVRSFITETLSKAQQQLSVLSDLINRGISVPFRRDGKLVWELDGSSIGRVVVVAVTLEDASMYSAGLRHLVESGLMAATKLPWVVLLYDLRVITELCETPAQLLCFLDRRDALNRDGRFSTMGETDYWGWFLQKGLRFDLGDHANADMIQLASSTREIEWYYYHREGWRRTPTKRPQWDLPDTIKLLARALDSAPDRVRLQAALDLLDLAYDEQERFASEIARYVRLSRKDGKVRGFAIRPQSRPDVLWAFVTGQRPTVQDVDSWLARTPSARPAGTRQVVCFGIGPGPLVHHVVVHELASG